MLYLFSDSAAQVTGRRFIAAQWDTTLAPAEAAARAAAPVAWTELAGKAIEPGTAQTQSTGLEVKRFTIVMAGLLWAAVLLAAAPARCDDGVTDDTIRIGAHGPLTGPAAFVGFGSRAGMELAVQQINAAGGINGRNCTLYEDDGILRRRRSRR